MGQHAGACFRRVVCVHTHSSGGVTFNMLSAKGQSRSTVLVLPFSTQNINKYIKKKCSCPPTTVIHFKSFVLAQHRVLGWETWLRRKQSAVQVATFLLPGAVVGGATSSLLLTPLVLERA